MCCQRRSARRLHLWICYFQLPLLAPRHCQGANAQGRFERRPCAFESQSLLLPHNGLRVCLRRVYLVDDTSSVAEGGGIMPRKAYPSDLSDAQWALLAPLIPPAKPGG